MGRYQDVIAATDGVIARWKLDETSGTVADDDVGTFDGTYTSSPTLDQDPLVASGGGRAVKFASGPSVVVPNGGYWAQDTFSVEAWFRWDGPSSGADFPAVLGDLSVATTGWAIILNSTDREIRFQIRGATQLSVRGFTPATTGSVFYAVATYERAANSVKLYINGVLAGSGSFNTYAAPATASLRIGTAGGASVWNGAVDEVALYSRALSAEEVLSHFQASIPIVAVTYEPPSPRLVTLTASGTEATDLTDQVDGLNWSSVQPGGDERCSFELKRKWFAGSPEISMGKLCRVSCGLDVLWFGRIEENDRAVSDSEKIGVTAYGLGNRLKDDGSKRLLVVDRDLSQWKGPGLAERVAIIGNSGQSVDPTVGTDQAGAPALILPAQSAWSATTRPIVDAWYDAGPGQLVGVISGTWTRGANLDSADANWTWQYLLSSDDHQSVTGGASGNLRAAGPANILDGFGTPRRFLLLQLLYGTVANATDNKQYDLFWSNLAVHGTHGITRQGATPAAYGYLASDVVSYVLGLASGITARRVDASTFSITHLLWRDGVTVEQMIVDSTRFENPGINWGTWGPDSVLDTSLNGQFDWRAKDLTTAHWRTLRSGCDDISLNVELATLYDTVDVVYTDAAGTQGVETRTAVVPALAGAGIIGKKPPPLQGGTLTQSGAQQLGDAFLQLSAQRPPARGSISLSGPISHYRRGSLPPIYMRADGANLSLPDVLPSEDALSLSSAPDRRTLFPIKRVSVDCSGQIPKVSVDVDQSNDLLSILQARLQLAAQLSLGH